MTVILWGRQCLHFWRWGTWGSDRLSDGSKTTQLLSIRAGIWTQDCLALKLVVVFGYCAYSVVTSIALELVGKAVSGPTPNLLKCNLFTGYKFEKHSFSFSQDLAGPKHDAFSFCLNSLIWAPGSCLWSLPWVELSLLQARLPSTWNPQSVPSFPVPFLLLTLTPPCPPKLGTQVGLFWLRLSAGIPCHCLSS